MSTEFMRSLHQAFGPKPAYYMHAIMPISNECTYRVSLQTRIDRTGSMDKPPLKMKFQRFNKKGPYRGATLGPGQTSTTIVEPTIKSIRFNGTSIDFQLTPTVAPRDDGTSDWVMTIFFDSSTGLEPVIVQPSSIKL